MGKFDLINLMTRFPDPQKRCFMQTVLKSKVYGDHPWYRKHIETMNTEAVNKINVPAMIRKVQGAFLLVGWKHVDYMQIENIII